MAALDISAFSYALKRLYPKDKLLNQVYQGSGPLFMWLPKSEGFVGENFQNVVLRRDIAGRSASFSTAQSNKDGSKGNAFTVTRVKDYGLASIDTEVILASEKDEGALLRATKREMDAAINALGRSLGISLYRDGSGQIGQVANTSFATTVLTLTQASDVTNFEEGMVLVFAQDTASALRSGSLTITAINRDPVSPTITVNANLSTVTGIATNDSIFAQGDYTAANDKRKAAGLSAWISSSASPAALFGVTRTTDVIRLAGSRVDGSGLTLAEALNKAAMEMGVNGGLVGDKAAFMNFRKYEQLVNLLGSKVIYDSVEEAQVAFQGVKLLTPNGPVMIFPDINCPSDKCYVLNKASWEWMSLGPTPRILDQDGNTMLRESSADAIEIRVAYFGNLVCKAPAWNVVINNFGA
jgi:hypothetical protein